MKRYKLINGEGWGDFSEGQIYDSNYRNMYGLEVEYLATEGLNRGDWEEVVEVVETDEEILNQLIDDYWFDKEDAKEFLSKFNEMKEIFSNNTTIYEIADFINKLK